MVSGKADSTKIIDSINAVRTKINDSIKAKNSENRFKNLEGDHPFTHHLIKTTGTVNFKRMGRDNYDVSGKIQSGRESVTIKGTAVVVSPKHMNFTGEITQTIQANDHGKLI